MEIHRSALKHSLTRAGINHAIDHALVEVELEPDADPPRVLAIGADQAGNLLEVIWLELGDQRAVVIHAMPLRKTFYALLPDREDDQ